ncbi:hypothetical protein M409DRAFT_52653 [Zasmidium cellare ATCC 36951]|uniref:Uncharacterized protein n=1 Tax=Zasmidium cellare ATCC 36951 TaxID=1080233 RepID=A0A6A6CV70_ZASCE|nr:uncharacterized protein M409DRAFT_52653 [Zasmidium cellare ATCC 36951]KAF2169406.1 hypothetical protein M409DRAFT_52653 [Zasmidium cellare ATCC 36951]
MANNANRINPQPSTAVQNDLSKDITIQDSPQDSISDLRFNPQVEHLLAAASWDNTVRIYDINQTGGNKGVAMFSHEGPVLSCCWSPDGQTLFGAGIDKTIRMLDLSSNSQQQFPTTHTQPIRSIHSFTINSTPILTTASWDTTLKYWDLRQRHPIATLACRDKIYSTSIRNNTLLVIATADRNIHIIDLNNPTRIHKTLLSPLKHQTRIVQTYLDGTGFALGGIEGRCAFQYIEEKDSAKNYTFRCHRQPQTPPSSSNTSKIYALNAISTHPLHGTFSTAGSDGTFHFWDKDSRTRLKGFPEVGGAISATDFSRKGDVFAYAVGYDWSMGYMFNTPRYPCRIVLHPVGEEECKPRGRGSVGR